ncbi:MAG TPA: type II and III secretion system protein family protein [Phycisphaerae bacterium]
MGPIGPMLALLIAGTALGQAPAAPPGAAEEKRFEATVRNMTEGIERITIPVNRSVLIDTSVPIDRVQAVAGDIAFAQVVSPTQVLVTGLRYGQTQIMLWTQDSRRRIYEVLVELDLGALNAALAKVDPLSKAEANPMMGNIVLTGTVSGARVAERMVELANLFVPSAGGRSTAVVQNHLQVSGEQQVLLRCTVAEVSRTAIRELGINGFLAGENFRDAFVVNQIGGINPINIGAAAGANVRSNLPFLTGPDGIPISGQTTLSLGFPRVQLQVFLRALAENSLMHVLAEPNLTAISGETATFLAGGEFPIPVPQGGSAAGAITIEFREFGIRLNFTPLVQAHQRIRLRVRPEVSQTDFSNAVQLQGFVVPGLTQRTAETTVELGNGQTIAIAGLLSEEVRGLSSRVPGLGDVPVLGALFRSIRYQRSQSELVILVTPEIIAPMDPNQVPDVPGKNLNDPNDFELYALGILEGGVPHDECACGRPCNECGANDAPSEPHEMSLHGPWGPAGEREMR